MGSSCSFASRETSRGVLQAVTNQGGLVSLLASGPSACPKNARDLTVSTVIVTWFGKIFTERCGEKVKVLTDDEI
jgi:hypothetical protein